MKEFIFSSKVDVTYDQLLPYIQGRGDIGMLGAFEIGKSTATVIRGDKLHFIAVGKGVADESDIGFFREILMSVEKSFDAAIDTRIKAAQEAEQRAKQDQETAKQAQAALENDRKDFVQEGAELGNLRGELDRLSQETARWQEELREFETQVNERHAQINDRVTLLLEREQALVRSQQAFDVASEAKRALIRKMQEGAADSLADFEAGLAKISKERAELSTKESEFKTANSDFLTKRAQWEKQADEARDRKSVV